MAESAYQTGTLSPPGLTAWTLATLNTTVFVLALVLPSYASGGLSDVLPTLNTGLGLGIFGCLWLIFWMTTRRLLDVVEPGEDPLRRVLVWATAAGAVDGIVFLLGLVLVVGLPTAVTTSLELLSVGLIALIGIPIAAVVGAVVGLLAVLLDLSLLGLATRFGPRPLSDSDSRPK